MISPKKGEIIRLPFVEWWESFGKNLCKGEKVKERGKKGAKTPDKILSIYGIGAIIDYSKGFCSDKKKAEQSVRRTRKWIK